MYSLKPSYALPAAGCLKSTILGVLAFFLWPVIAHADTGTIPLLFTPQENHQGVSTAKASTPVASNPGASTPGPIVLRTELLAIRPKEFYIAGLVDERADPSAVAWMLPPANSSNGTADKLIPVDLKGGGKEAIQDFMFRSLPRNKTLRPVIIRLKECRVIESAGEEGLVEGRVVVSIAFGLQGEEELIHLADYKGGLRYKRSASQHGLVEPALRRSLTAALEYLNTWMDREAPRHEKLALGVKVFITDHTLNVEDDTVFYASDRPLQWEDFRAKPRGNRYTASIFPSFAYQGDSEIVDGYVHLYLNMKVFMLKNSSWVKEGTKDAYGLNHEQRHFDIVKLVVERFKQKIGSLSLSPEDYDGVIAYHYIEAFREMNRLQEEYDHETRHGINRRAQENWNRRLELALKSFGE